jgi:hypothetical protein
MTISAYKFAFGNFSQHKLLIEGNEKPIYLLDLTIARQMVKIHRRRMITIAAISTWPRFKRSHPFAHFFTALTLTGAPKFGTPYI